MWGNYLAGKTDNFSKIYTFHLKIFFILLPQYTMYIYYNVYNVELHNVYFLNKCKVWCWRQQSYSHDETCNSSTKLANNLQYFFSSVSLNDNILLKIASYMILKTLTFRESTQNYQTQKEISCSIFRLPPKVANQASPQVTTFRQERACLATVTSMWRQWIYWRNVSSGNNAHVTGSEKKAGKYFLVWNVDG